MPGLLLINPRSGDDTPSPEDLQTAAAERGIDARVLGDGDDPAALAREADATALGMAGGDGSLAPVAEVAMERDLSFVCVPLGTRNHFARDLGFDRDDPIAALDSFEGDERRIDVGLVGERVFLNNVSLGLYARLVHQRERHRRRREALARARALWMLARDRRGATRFTIDDEVVSARVVLVANNDYLLDEPFSIGERERLDEGLLHLYAAHGILRRTWDERSAEHFTVDVRKHRVEAAIDGEPALLETPLEFSIRPRALRVLVPPG